MINELKNMINAATGVLLSDLVIKNVSVFHLTTGNIELADIAIVGDKIVAVGENYQGKSYIDGTGLFAVPAFIDAHAHVESSMLTPFNFEQLLLEHGVTTMVCDPHELANVVGTDAFDYFLAAAKEMILDLKVQISSCVPATNIDTNGASINSDDTAKYVNCPNSIGLGEMMNVPALLNCDDEVIKKISKFSHIDGHAPLLSGKDLNGYIVANIHNCHESTNLIEAREKIERGMHLFIREGSVAKNLASLAPLITVENSPFISFCSDDRDVIDIMEEGHIDYMIAKAISLGASPLACYRGASYSCAKHFKLDNLGLIAPAYKADIVLLSSLEKCKVEMVIKSGKVVDKELFKARNITKIPEYFYNSVKCRELSAADFKVYAKDGEVEIIKIEEFQILTQAITTKLELIDNELISDLNQDILKVAVVERHGKNGNIGLGFVQGFGLKQGAIASSVAHDSHNISVVGTNDDDMAVAVNALRESQGGFVVVISGEVKAIVKLEIGGLISTLNYHELYRDLKNLHDMAKLTSCKLGSPFLQLAFLSLVVIPEIRLTDCGLFKL